MSHMLSLIMALLDIEDFEKKTSKQINSILLHLFFPIKVMVYCNLSSMLNQKKKKIHL